MDFESEATSGSSQGRGSGQQANAGAQSGPIVNPNSQTGVQNTLPARSGDITLPEVYHLTGMDNYGLWSYRMKNILKRENLYTWCMTLASTPMPETEARRREQALSIINSNAKGTALRNSGMRLTITPGESF
jgi:hypothetical protein